MPQPSEHAARYIAACQPKMDAHHAVHRTTNPPRYDVCPGRRWDKIVLHYGNGQTFARCFIERDSGEVYKAAGWAAPAPGARYSDTDTAIKAWDPHGAEFYMVRVIRGRGVA